MSRPTVLYDSDCGFCKWTVASILRWDRKKVLLPVEIQSDIGQQLLGSMDKELQLKSWHFVSEEGGLYSAGAAFPPLLRLLPGGRPFAWICQRIPRLLNRMYYWVAANRTAISRFVPASSKRKAASLISARSGF